ncbi:type III secretion system apparatus protein VscT2 [Yersinia enterocolitica]|uniref:type III secretion system apparatus protein VscT2 n=1 Tax=Yersinia enterocolitica TaxID=630 RepID=UPI003F44DC1E
MMEAFISPSWLSYAAFFIFLKIYNPTRLFLDNITIIAISIFFAIYVTYLDEVDEPDYRWIIGATMLALFSSVPFWLGSMVGSIIQQLLLLNEQSVQDKRFTEETEALARISGLLFVIYALNNGSLFIPIINLLNGDVSIVLGDNPKSELKQLYFLIVNYLKMTVIVASKYIIAIISISISVAMVDLFFKKASLSTFVTANLKAMLVIILLNTWFFNDQLYLFQKMTGAISE